MALVARETKAFRIEIPVTINTVLIARKLIFMEVGRD